jgi:hypothetical protein
MRARWFTRHGLTALLVPVALIGSGIASAATGTSWTAKEPRNPGSVSNVLYGVAMVSPGQAWAVGAYSDESGGTTSQSLIESWNGTSWKRLHSLNPGGASDNNELTAVAANSATDAWAVGSHNNGSYRTLIGHWNGSSWKRVPSPNPNSFGSSLNGVAVTSSTDAWAVGTYFDTRVDDDGTLFEHWDGTSWTVVPSPNPVELPELYGVAADSATDVWAVGDSYDGALGQYQTLIEHWDGTSWTVVPSPSPGTGGDGDQLYAVTAISSTSAWAAGDYTTVEKSKTLALHCC